MLRTTAKFWAVAGLFLSLAASAQTATEPEAVEEQPTPSRFRIRFELKGAYRDSDANAFPSPFPFPPQFIPVGQQRVFLRTVDPGDHLEFVVATLYLDADLGRHATAHVKLDAGDLSDRNPTSTDKKFDVDELWLRIGHEAEPAMMPERRSAYLKLGKFAHFERQDDRHLESYGLVATAFNRFEDQGIEVGVDFSRHFYLKASFTQGNPVFIRDPNALAGDNGTPDGLKLPPQPELNSGIVILYDAEVEDLDFGGPYESGAALGMRFGDETGARGIDFMVWGYRRDLADAVDLHGTLYGGDLDLLNGPELPPPFPRASLPITGDSKREAGANLWIYRDGLTLFAQYVDQDLAGLKRTGYEGELAYKFELPVRWALAGRQLFPSIAPAVRYSRLDPEIVGGGPFPAVSVRWDWTKIDYGVRIGILPGFDLTVEYADNDFFIPSLQAHRSNNELLATLRFKH